MMEARSSSSRRRSSSTCLLLGRLLVVACLWLICCSRAAAWRELLNGRRTTSLSHSVSRSVSHSLSRSLSRSRLSHSLRPSGSKDSGIGHAGGAGSRLSLSLAAIDKEQEGLNVRVLFSFPLSPSLSPSGDNPNSGLGNMYDNGKDSVVHFIQHWAEKELQKTGTVIELTALSDGVRFHFHPSSSAFLKIYTAESSFSVDIIAEWRPEVEQTQLHDLISLVSSNLLKSIVWEIGEKLLQVDDDMTDPDIASRQHSNIGSRASQLVHKSDVSSININKLWNAVPYEAADIELLNSMRERGEISDTANLPRSLADVKRLVNNDLHSKFAKSGIKTSNASVAKSHRELYSWSLNSVLRAETHRSQVASYLGNWFVIHFNHKGNGIVVDRNKYDFSVCLGGIADPSLLITVVQEQSCVKVLSSLRDCNSISSPSLSDTYTLVVEKLERNISLALESFTHIEDVDVSSAGQIPKPLGGSIDSVHDIEDAFKALQVPLLIPNNTSVNSQQAKFSGHTSAVGTRRKLFDPVLAERAQQVGLDLELLDESGKQYAASELQRIIKQNRGGGLLAVVRDLQGQIDHIAELGPLASANYSINTDGSIGITPNLPSHGQDRSIDKEQALSALFAFGRNVSELNLETILQKSSHNELLQQFEGLTAKMLPSTSNDSVQCGLDWKLYNTMEILERSLASDTPASQPNQFVTRRPSTNFKLNEQRLNLLIEELRCIHGSPITQEPIFDAFRDVLLSSDLLLILRERSQGVHKFDALTATIYNQIIARSIDLYKELALLIQHETAKHLGTVQEICALCENYQAPEQELAFLNAMDKIKPLFDTKFLQFLEYAILEEEERTMKSLKNADLQTQTVQHLQEALQTNKWLQVLQIIHKGVLLEFAQRFDYLLDCIYFFLKIPLEVVREQFFRNTVDTIPIVDLPHLRELALNIVDFTAMQLENGGNVKLDVEDGQRKLMVDKEFISLLETQPMIASGIHHLKVCLETILSEKILREKMEKYQEELSEQGLQLTFKLRNPVKQFELEVQEEQARSAAIEGKKWLDTSNRKLNTKN